MEAAITAGSRVRTTDGPIFGAEQRRGPEPIAHAPRAMMRTSSEALTLTLGPSSIDVVQGSPSQFVTAHNTSDDGAEQEQHMYLGERTIKTEPQTDSMRTMFHFL